MLSVHSCTNGDPKGGGLAGRLSKPGPSLGEGNERQLEGSKAFEKKQIHRRRGRSVVHPTTLSLDSPSPVAGPPPSPFSARWLIAVVCGIINSLVAWLPWQFTLIGVII